VLRSLLFVFGLAVTDDNDLIDEVGQHRIELYKEERTDQLTPTAQSDEMKGNKFIPIKTEK